MAKAEVLTIDANSRSSIQSPDLCLTSPPMTRALECVTSPASLLRSYRHNPWIGGPNNVLPSPTSTALRTNDASKTTVVITSSDDIIDASDSSCIDDSNVAENMSPLKRTYEQQKNNKMDNIYGITTDMSNSNNNIIVSSNNNNIKTVINTLKNQENMKINKTINGNDDDNEDENGASMSKRKRSISFLDSNNPLMTPFLMDLCNDDYHMNAKDYLQENFIENVLNEWPVDLV